MRHIIRYKAALLAALGVVISPLSHASISDRPSFTVPPIIILWAANDDTGEVPIVTDFIVQGSNGLNTDLIDVDGRSVATVTGALVPTTDAAFVPNSSADFRVLLSPTNPVIPIDTDGLTSFSPFEINGSTDIRTSTGISHESDIFVASNTPFNITTNIQEVQTSGDFGLDDVRLSFSIQTNDANAPIPFGASARDPGGIKTQLQTLADLNGVDILQSARSTAAASGSIADQSVKIQLYYDIAEYDVTELPDGSGPLISLTNSALDLSYGSGTVIADVTYTAYVP